MRLQAGTAKSYAIIGGSGFHELGANASKQALDTPFGPPSDSVSDLEIGASRVYFLARHGAKHSIAPHEINYRANMAALKQLGVDSIIALNTVGVIPATPAPGSLALPAQLIDYTWGRAQTVHGPGGGDVVHVDFTEPFSASLRKALLDCALQSGLDCFDGGVYACTQGPRLETAAEIDRLERDGAHFVGMTAMPEAVLARELDMDYVCLCLIVNYGAGRSARGIHEDIEITLHETRQKAMRLLNCFFA